MTLKLQLGSVSLDCADPRELVRFYARLFGVEVAYETDDFAAIRLESIWLSMVKVESYSAPTWPDDAVPKQVHLDLAVTDLDEGEKAAVAAGATRMSVQPNSGQWTVMSDPAGHPFCLTTLIPD